MVGVPYGVALWLFERLSLRRVRVLVALPSLLASSLLVEGVIVWIEIERRKLLDAPLLPQMVAVLVGLAISVFSSDQA